MNIPRHPALLRRPLSSHLQFLLLIAGSYCLIVFLYSVFFRFTYPYELDLIEGGMLEQVRHVAHGGSLYAKPSLEFAAFIYGPLFTYLAAYASAIFGEGFENIRLLSILATVFSCVAIFQIVRKGVGSRLPGFFAAMLFLGTYADCGFSFDQGRVDALFVSLLLWGYYFLRFGSAERGWIAAALLLAAAFFTKQIALIPILCLIPVARQRGTRCFLLFCLCLLMLCVGGAFAINYLSGGWYFYYAFDLPAQHDTRVAYYQYFWLSDVLLVMPIAALLSVFGLYLQAKRSRDETFIGNLSLLSGFVMLSWVSRLHAGGIENVLAPAYAAFSIVAVSTLPYLKHIASGYALLFAQFLLLIHPVNAALPPSADRAADDQIVKLISSYVGDVFVPYHPYLLSLSGKQSHVHHWALYDVLRGDPDGEAPRLRQELESAFSARKFAAIITDDGWFKDQIERFYAWKAKLQPGDPTVRSRSGEPRTRPENLYEPKPY
ncbi:MAG: glycosyltransferase family 39 protein [Deltaproteobacteria bacterium]|nr:glycosyltransferase family 39 protein [Deltaproteobacteria bacterium]